MREVRKTAASPRNVPVSAKSAKRMRFTLCREKRTATALLPMAHRGHLA